MISIVYVSRSRIDPRDRPRVLDDILTFSTDRNSTLGISGVLIASPTHFAQLLEGPIDSVEALMSRITVDPRHEDLRVIRTAQITEPCCPQWRMAQFDRGNFGNSIVDPLLMAVHAGEQTQAIARLDYLIEGVLNLKKANFLV